MGRIIFDALAVVKISTWSGLPSLRTSDSQKEGGVPLRGSPPSGIVFRYSWADLAEIFREYVCCVNLISCKFFIHKIFVLTSYWQISLQNGGVRKVPISRIVEEVES